MINSNLDSQRRTALRQLVIGRGPDAGRRVGRLTARSLSPDAAVALQMAELGGMAVPEAGLLAGASGVYFLSNWSQSDGEDITV